MAVMTLRSGVYPKLETEADIWLENDKAATGGHNHGCWFGILSPAQLELRAQREIPTPNLGTMVNHGIYGRAYNPRMGQRPDRWDNANPYDKPIFEKRVSNIRSGWSAELLWPKRDPAGQVLPRDGYYWHLDRFQRSRIRAIMAKLPAHRQDARRVVKAILGVKYGVPDFVIARCLPRKL